MEGLFYIFLFVGGGIIVLPIVAMAVANGASRRAHKLAERVRSLEEELGRQNELLSTARRQIKALRAASGAAKTMSPAVAPEGEPVAAPPVAPAQFVPPPPPSIAAPPVTSSPAAASPGASPPVAPPSAPPQPVAPPPADPPRSAVPEAPFDWERWVGVRGAAVLGAIVLALAAILFFRYAIEHSMLSPTLRVVLGTLVGVAALSACDRLRKRYGVTAHALAGGGMVVLYATFWAASTRYALVSLGVGFGLMALTTTVGCLLAVRYASLLIAVLGLVGGFLTPILLSSGQDRPIGLFGYVLLLDTGFILAARKRGWNVVLGLLLAGTLLLEAGWIVGRMGPERTGLGLLIVAVFVGVFVLGASKPPSAERGSWLLTQSAALILPLGFALYFASLSRLGMDLWPLALLLGLVATGANFVARSEARARWLPLAIAVATPVVVAVWLGSAAITPELAWQIALSALGLALVFRPFAELERTDESFGPAARAAVVAELGLFACVIGAAALGPVARIDAWLVGFIGFALLLLTHVRLPARALISPLAAALLALALVTFQNTHRGAPELPDRSAYFAVEVALALGLQVLCMIRPKTDWLLAAAAFPGLLLLGILTQQWPTSADSPWKTLVPLLALSALGTFAATRQRDARWLPPLAAVHVIAHHASLEGLKMQAEQARVAFFIGVASTLFFALWPRLVQARLREPRWALYTSALAGPAWFFDLRTLYEQAFGTGSIGLLSVALGALSLGILARASRSTAVEPGLRRSALVWHAAVALGFASAAIPLQLDRQWITIGWALESAAVLLLFRKLDHPGLKWFGLTLAAAVGARLLLNPALLDYEERSLPFLNWLLYTYWVPVIALFAGFRLLKDVEVPRARDWERGIYAKGQAFGAFGLLGLVIVLVFAWLNLAIIDAFSDGSSLVLDLPRRPARDLTISLSWVAYGGLLLAVGMVKASRGLRWLSLAFLILSIGKVFLYDLGELRDLYRVLSLLGLAVSLITVSLAYQRFVFRSEPQPRGS